MPPERVAEIITRSVSESMSKTSANAVVYIGLKQSYCVGLFRSINGEKKAHPVRVAPTNTIDLQMVIKGDLLLFPIITAPSVQHGTG